MLRCFIDPESAHKSTGYFCAEELAGGRDKHAGGREHGDGRGSLWLAPPHIKTWPSCPHPPELIANKSAQPFPQTAASRNRLARKRGVSQGFCNRFNRMTVGKEVGKAARMGANSHGKLSVQWLCTLLFPVLQFTFSAVLCGLSSSIFTLQGQVGPSGLCLLDNKISKSKHQRQKLRL